MPRHVVPLTESKVRNAKPRAKEYKLSDGGGLFLLVIAAGGKYWRMKYRFGGKDMAPLSLGVYPEVSLAEARERREAARRKLRDGIDPREQQKALRAAKVAEAENSFEIIAREWYNRWSSGWSPSHALTVIGRLNLDVFPRLGARPIGEITAPEVLKMLRAIEFRGALETAHRVRTICGQVFRYAVATGRAERDPTADLRDALKPYKKGHLPAITDLQALVPLLRAIDAYKGTHVVKCALMLVPLLMVRPGMLREAEWDEMNLDEAIWSVPAEKMKTDSPHIVPLPLQAVAILRDLRELTGRGKFVFPSHGQPDKPMSEGAIPAALKKLGYKGKQTAHGFRATARTILDEVLQQRPDFIEHQLAHAVRDPLGRAYNRTSHLVERKKMMQRWADYLDGLKSSGANPLSPSVL
ncbi:tyrosine-type recombinase/integrase [Candidatus Deferrimicrobium sp.]|uniref:tyrosine-type recombinase/integrase n=1 Tax=Candidatus Deferrimicrobium sp. TaxID=3060586 RepID=UPI002ED27437